MKSIINILVIKLSILMLCGVIFAQDKNISEKQISIEEKRIEAEIEALDDSINDIYQTFLKDHQNNKKEINDVKKAVLTYKSKIISEPFIGINANEKKIFDDFKMDVSTDQMIKRQNIEIERIDKFIKLNNEIPGDSEILSLIEGIKDSTSDLRLEDYDNLFKGKLSYNTQKYKNHRD